MSGSQVAAVAMVAGTIMVARSPSSAIAIVQELRAKGPFTDLTIGVTVVMDLVVIVLFSSIQSPLPCPSLQCLIVILLLQSTC